LIIMNEKKLRNNNAHTYYMTLDTHNFEISHTTNLTTTYT